MPGSHTISHSLPKASSRNPLSSEKRYFFPAAWCRQKSATSKHKTSELTRTFAFSLEVDFRPKNWPLKRLNDAFFLSLDC
jgi:hypothetical protein